MNRLSAALPRASTPVLAQVLERRAVGVAIGAAALAHLALLGLDLPAWPCPLRDTVGLPCPGCGLSRALTALLHGQWRAALVQHAFAPVLLAGLVLITGMALLPEAARRQGISVVARFERRTGLTALLLVGLMAYWLTRLVFFRSAFIDSTR